MREDLKRRITFTNSSYARMNGRVIVYQCFITSLESIKTINYHVDQSIETINYYVWNGWKVWNDIGLPPNRTYNCIVRQTGANR